QPVSPIPPAVDVIKYHERLDAVTDEILNACRADRQESQDVINLYRGAIDNANLAGRDPARMYVDGLVKAIEVKSNINMTAVKVLEANAKMLAATKAGGTLIQNNINQTNGSSDVDLQRVLDKLGDDDF